MQRYMKHRIFSKKLVAAIAMAFVLVSVSFGQTTLKVASKSLKEHFNYLPGMEVNVEGQKAEIVIETWDKNSVEIIIDFIAKHPSEMIAKKDLKCIKYSYKTALCL